MVFRMSEAGTTVIRLDTGPVVGLLPECSYEQGSIVLERNDCSSPSLTA